MPQEKGPPPRPWRVVPLADSARGGVAHSSPRGQAEGRRLVPPPLPLSGISVSR